MDLKKYITELFNSIFTGGKYSKICHQHIAWIDELKHVTYKTADSANVSIYELVNQGDKKTISRWATHLRNHYELDEDIDKSRSGTNLSRKDYLLTLKFPDEKKGFGPAVRAGDFNEILFADFIEEKLDFIVPRVRYLLKENPNESPKGTDVIGFKLYDKRKFSSMDELITFESKSLLSPKRGGNPFQNALTDSLKDVSDDKQARLSYSLNAMKRKLNLHKQENYSKLVERFQDKNTFPYTSINGAGAVIDKSYWKEDFVLQSNADLTKRQKYRFIIILGDSLMNLVNELYKRAADEA